MGPACRKNCRLMSFNAFEIMKNSRNSSDTLEVSRKPSNAEESINKIDRFVCLMVCKTLGLEEASADAIKKAFVECKEGVRNIQKLEHSGQKIQRVFCKTTWQELIRMTSLDEVRQFCSSPFMHPLVLCKIVMK